MKQEKNHSLKTVWKGPESFCFQDQQAFLVLDFLFFIYSFRKMTYYFLSFKGYRAINKQMTFWHIFPLLSFSKKQKEKACDQKFDR